MMRKIFISSFSNAIIDGLFYHLDCNKKIKDFYCIIDEMVTPSSDPRIEKDMRGKTLLNCKCETCGRRKKKYITNTLNIYKADEYEYTDDEDDEDDKDEDDKDEDDKDEDEEKIKRI